MTKTSFVGKLNGSMGYSFFAKGDEMTGVIVSRTIDS
jgi:hypothetical protein